MNYSPANDGIDHINVYSKGRTELGRFLSNFAHTPIMTEDGPFSSVEGYWYWLGCTHPDKDDLRGAHGFHAKQLGRDLGASDWIDSETFKRKIESAILIKLWENQKLTEQLVANTLPLTHYYVYGGKVINVPEADWILEILRKVKER